LFAWKFWVDYYVYISTKQSQLGSSLVAGSNRSFFAMRFHWKGSDDDLQIPILQEWHQPEINGIQLILIFCTLDTWNMIVFPFSVSQVLTLA
jgi:hypothetical protein